ncbi:hypothetical protein QBC40DRAFT_97464 [Triangularia verruculosa]|uniref:SsuA/THI5-like domain-containing protein n=1 Tax=Triangularia verruculosa TaxID=2587418 RepID=A0AAN6XCJ5_9PEZI|nr:hypothetical protein QBC40DRAFT_97464 [Triangularia verruculosa]
MARLSLLVPLLGLLTTPTTAVLTISAALNVIEYTPLLTTSEDYHNSSAIFINGGVATLVRNSSIDLGANAETQALRNYANNTSLRIIWNIAEVPYRLVANRAAGISSLSDLKGKRIGTINGTSAGYFVEQLLKTVGLEYGDYQTVPGNICHEAPCGNRTFPDLLAKGEIDAFGIWEPTLQLGIEALPDKQAIVFQNRKVYREIYNLHSTKEKLADKKKRREIVVFLKNLIKAQRVFEEEPEEVYGRVSAAVNVSVPLLERVWRVHDWSGGIPRDLVDVLEEEEKYIARVDNRTASGRRHVAKMVDGSVLVEALALLRKERGHGHGHGKGRGRGGD